MPSYEFIKGMKLTKAELKSFEELINQLELAAKDPVSFQRTGGSVAFTPGAALAIAVAKFAYDVYKDYKNSWIPGDKEFELIFKDMIQGYHKLKSGQKLSAAKLSAFSDMRKAVLKAQKG
jgi:hypothetical protein